jgi:uncharacterized membrane protein YbaN (DUF454 family)
LFTEEIFGLVSEQFYKAKSRKPKQWLYKTEIFGHVSEQVYKAINRVTSNSSL